MGERITNLYAPELETNPPVYTGDQPYYTDQYGLGQTLPYDYASIPYAFDPSTYAEPPPELISEINYPPELFHQPESQSIISPPNKSIGEEKLPPKHVHSAEGLISTTDHGRPVVLAKRYPLLFIVFVIMVMAGIGTAAFGYNQAKFGYPPTEFSETAYSDTLFALVGLFFVCLSSIIVLLDKVRNLAIGYVIMFGYVCTFYFCLKGASRAYVSIKYDDIITIEKYIFSENGNRTDGVLPHFFQRLQTNFKCCGTTSVDKMKDWPYRLRTFDLPESCCKRTSPNCGQLLARTHNYITHNNNGAVNQPMRTPSGYFLALTESELDFIVESGKPVKIRRVPEKDKGIGIFLNNLKNFYFQSLKLGYPPGTPLSDIRRTPNDIVEPIDIGENFLPTAIGCRDDKSFEKATTVGWEMQYLLDYETSAIQEKSSPPKHDWMAWKIPTCREITGEPPFHVASNYEREISNARQDVKHMWYISRGIAENIILKDVIWERSCESEGNDFLAHESKIVKWISGDKRTQRRDGTQTAVGNFFITFVQRLMVSCLVISAITAVVLFIAFLIFWKYYSRMKVEEYANLPYPPEFDELKVRHKDLYETRNKAEYHKEKFKTLLVQESAEDLATHTPGPTPDPTTPTPDYESIREEFDKLFGPSAPPAHRPSLGT